MTSAEVKAAIDHVFTDIEAVATAIGKGATVAEIEKVKTLFESPLVLEVVSLAVTFGLAKIGLAAEAPAANPAAPSA